MQLLHSGTHHPDRFLFQQQERLLRYLPLYVTACSRHGVKSLVGVWLRVQDALVRCYFNDGLKGPSGQSDYPWKPLPASV